MLTSYCDNVSTHHYHVTYHPCFDTQFLDGQTIFSRCCHVIQKKAKAMKLSLISVKRKQGNCLTRIGLTNLPLATKGPIISSTSLSLEAAGDGLFRPYEALPKTMVTNVCKSAITKRGKGVRNKYLTGRTCLAEWLKFCWQTLLIGKTIVYFRASLNTRRKFGSGCCVSCLSRQCDIIRQPYLVPPGKSAARMNNIYLCPLFHNTIYQSEE